MEYSEIEIEREEGVYEPSEDSELAAGVIAECLSEMRPKGRKLEVLDMGTATGILGIFAACSEAAGSVTLADINPKALSLARRNALGNKAHVRAKLAFVQTDLFAGIGEKEVYDLIVFNAPYLRSDIEEGSEDIRWSGGREGVELSIRFLEGAAGHMREGCRIILIVSSLSDLVRLRKRIVELGFVILKEAKRHYFFEDILALLIVKAWRA